MKQKTDFKIS